MNPGIEYYRPFGQPSSGYYIFVSNPAKGATLTVNGVAFVVGTDFGLGATKSETAQNFAMAVNADRARYAHAHDEVSIIRDVFAVFLGDRVVIIATAPGTAGDAYTLASDTTAVTVSGATLSGGAAGAAIAATAAAPVYTACTLLTWGDFVKTVAAVADTLTPISTFYRQAILSAAASNAGTAYFGPNSTCRHSLFPGTSYFIPMIPGAVYNMAAWYVKGTAGDTVTVLWVQ